MKLRLPSAWLLLVAACGHDAPPPKERAADLGGDVVARVGAEAISASLVADVARAKNVPPRAAMDDLIDDALAAQGARGAGLADDPGVRWPIISAQARVVAAHVRDDTRAKGPPTAEEIAELTALHWRKLDVPEGVKVIHAVAMANKHTPEIDAAARTTLDRIAAAVATAKTPEEFEAAARAVPAEKKVQTRVETLSLTVDGRSLDAPTTIEQPFVTAAVSLRAPGDKARATTTYGWHVLQLVERLPEHRVPLAERTALLEGEALAARARKAYDATLAELRGRYPVQISTAADALMQAVSLERP